MYNINKEIEDGNVEKLVLEQKNEAYQNSIAENLKYNGLGEKIRFELNNPIVITRFQMFKFKIKKFLKSIFNVL